MSFGPIHMEERRGYTIKIYQDEDAQSPREDYRLGTIVTFGRKRHLSDSDAPKFATPKEFLRFARQTKALYLPIYMYEHSMVALDTKSFVGRAQHAEWDSGQIGYIYITAADLRNEFLYKHITAKRRASAYEAMAGEVETYGSYLNGDVFEYVIESEDGNTVDSCCGCYGLEYTLSEALSAMGEDEEVAA
jgi:hypothetical protein